MIAVNRLIIVLCLCICTLVVLINFDAILRPSSL